MRLRVWVLVAAAGLRLAAGPATVVCLSCCPASAAPEVTLTSVGCCDEGCGDKVVRAETGPYVASVERQAASPALGVLPAGIVEFLPAPIASVFPATALRSGSPPASRLSPLRL